MIRVRRDEQGRVMVALFVCGCCTATTEEIPADWHTARRIVAGEPIVQRRWFERCDACKGHDAIRTPCAPRE